MSINSLNGIQPNTFSNPVDLPQIPTEKPAQALQSQPLANSMEEISMAFSESIERHSKTLHNREIAGRKSARTVERVEKLAELYRLLDQPSLTQMGKQAEQMRSLLNKNPSVEDLLDQVDKDPARASLLLQQMQRQAKAEGNLTDTQTAERYLQALEKDYGEQIRAGFNTAAAIADFSSDPQQKQAMRQLYYQAVVNQQSASGLLDSLLERFDEKDFNRGLLAMQRALADDIGALAPSLTPKALRDLLGQLNASSQLGHTLKSSRDLLERVGSEDNPPGMSAVQLTRRLLRLANAGVFVRDFQNLSHEVIGKEPLKQAPFLNALYPVVNELPVALWKDAKSRQSGLGILRTLMDEQARVERQLRTEPNRKASA
ncbi:SepL/TyeA/HrpJ family type III secretion system gatekeeper [Pseudomonas sp. PIC25]|uniref:type III secretion system gatekeeper subunit SctW n=1 Tax=Pseudomonas sp. PIC25 TaxID=1958773 RepID=UPI000BAB83B0|nr:type III secretion system gatekeeper subunit SctW [Pseudomonas sp. PIC25]PAU66304.1 SepL/TyeA/HrpJ family type III secretion system gatekeeper [Pseudomonas sp. PIC25]